VWRRVVWQIGTCLLGDVRCPFSPSFSVHPLRWYLHGASLQNAACLIGLLSAIRTHVCLAFVGFVEELFAVLHNLHQRHLWLTWKENWFYCLSDWQHLWCHNCNSTSDFQLTHKAVLRLEKCIVASLHTPNLLANTSELISLWR